MAVTPIYWLKTATKAVPAVRYAVGLIGVAAAVFVMRGFFKDVGIVAMFPLLGGTIVSMALLVILGRAVAAPDRDFRAIAKTFLWAVCVFIIAFMLLTVTAVAFGWPPNWAKVILPRNAAEAPLTKKIGGSAEPPVIDNTTDGGSGTELGNAASETDPVPIANFSAPVPPPGGADAAKVPEPGAVGAGKQGWMYYERRDEDETGEDGALRPRDSASLPRYDSIAIGARLETAQGGNLRTLPTSGAAKVVKKPLSNACLVVIGKTTRNRHELDQESGGWLKVRQVSCY